MAVNTVEYLRELAQSHNLGADNLGAVLKVLEGNPKFTEALGQSVARQAEFSRQMDELATKQREIEATATKQKEWWDVTKPAVDQAVTRAAEYERRFGKIDGTPRTPENTAGLTKEEVEKMLKESAETGMRFTANVSKQLGYVLQDYAMKFPGKALDLEAIEQEALKTGKTIRDAYEAHIRPEMEAKTKTAHEDELKKAREAGASEALSKHNIPVDSGPSEVAPFFQPRPEADKVMTDGQRARAFAETWNAEAGKGQQL